MRTVAVVRSARRRLYSPVDADWSVERTLSPADSRADPTPLPLSSLVAPAVSTSPLDLDLPIPSPFSYPDIGARGPPPFIGRDGSRVLGQDGELTAVFPTPVDPFREGFDRALRGDGERGAEGRTARGVAVAVLVERVTAGRVELEFAVGQVERVRYEHGRVRDVGRVSSSSPRRCRVGSGRSGMRRSGCRRSRRCEDGGRVLALCRPAFRWFLLVDGSQLS